MNPVKLDDFHPFYENMKREFPKCFRIFDKATGPTSIFSGPGLDTCKYVIFFTKTGVGLEEIKTFRIILDTDDWEKIKPHLYISERIY